QPPPHTPPPACAVDQPAHGGQAGADRNQAGDGPARPSLGLLPNSTLDLLAKPAGGLVSAPLQLRGVDIVEAACPPTCVLRAALPHGGRVDVPEPLDQQLTGQFVGP